MKQLPKDFKWSEYLKSGQSVKDYVDTVDFYGTGVGRVFRDIFNEKDKQQTSKEA